MDAPEPQPDPDGGDGPGHEPGGSPQDELDFSILFDYDYLNPIEGRWRLPEPGPRALVGTGPRDPMQGFLLELAAGVAPALVTERGVGVAAPTEGHCQYSEEWLPPQFSPEAVEKMFLPSESGVGRGACAQGCQRGCSLTILPLRL